jgi:RNA polymerase sigma-70 factor, ECF subfamily
MDRTATANVELSSSPRSFPKNVALKTRSGRIRRSSVALTPTVSNEPKRSKGYHSDRRTPPVEPCRPTNRFHDFVNAPNLPEITSLLLDWGSGNTSALDELLPLVESELRRLAHCYMRREDQNHTLQTTALVNEAYLKLADQKRTQWQNRAHFFGIAAQVMRRILLNHARDQHRQKRGGNAQRVSLSEATIVSRQRSRDLVALDEALRLLETIDKRKSQVVELRFFGGLDVEETAEVLGVSPITVMRDWKYARAWLMRELTNEV